MKSVKKIDNKPVVEAKEIYEVAIVKNGKYEVRRYNRENHGENFAELANQFALKKGYQVELF